MIDHLLRIPNLTAWLGIIALNLVIYKIIRPSIHRDRLPPMPPAADNLAAEMAALDKDMEKLEEAAKRATQAAVPPPPPVDKGRL